MIRTIALVCALLASCCASAHPVMDALKALEKTKMSDWQYRFTETDTLDDKVAKKVGFHDPSKPKGQRWLLDTFDGRAPTEKEYAKFLDDKKSVKDEKLSELIDERSLVALDPAGKAGRWSFKYKSDVDLDGIDPTKLSGVVSLDGDGEVAAIDISNADSFRLKMLMKVVRMVSHREFAKYANGVRYPRVERLEMELSLMGHKVPFTIDKVVELIKQNPAVRDEAVIRR